MIKTPESISNQRPENPALDFERLRQEGIQYIQELAGEFWTDYNDHDPGITILEQLCYALTDLAYRTDFEIQDHLSGSSQNSKPFFLPHQILPCRPLTVTDYRKMLIDAVPYLRNVWLQPTDPEENTLVGLYRIFADLESEISDTDTIKEKIRTVFCENRNLGEDFEDITILEPIYITLYADIEIENADALERILAKIYYELNEFLNPEIQFYSLSEMQKEGIALQNIFEGPLLKHGFIKEEELLEKPNTVPISEIIKIIMQVQGVVSVKNLYLKVGEKIYENQFFIPPHLKPRLILGSQPQATDFTINFYKGSAHYDQIDQVIFRRYLNELESARKRVYRVQEAFTQIPQGRTNLNLQAYYSIQNHFPIIYGIGEEGIPHQPDTERKAQAKQLKGFLMIFEQILSNYLAQLAHVRELFSPNTQSQKSYYAQSLDTAPSAKELYQRQENHWIEDALLKENLPQDYYQGLEILTRQQDNFGNRRNRFLDYLLAIHGETYLAYTASQKNFYFDRDGFQKFAIRNKTLFFQYLPQMGQARAKGYNYLLPTDYAENLSGLEVKLSTMLGINMHSLQDTSQYHLAKHSILGFIERTQLTFFEEDDAIQTQKWLEITNLAAQNIDEKQDLKYFDLIDEEDITELKIPQDKETLRKNMIFYQENLLPIGFLREGLNWKNYRLGQKNPEDKDAAWYLLFYMPSQESWHYLATYTSEQEALQAIKILWEDVRELNLQSEGLHLFEHILLRPSVDEEKFGFFLVDSEGKPILRSINRYNFKARQEAISMIEPHLFDYENYAVEQRGDGDFEIIFQAKEGKIQFVSLLHYESVQEIHEKMEDIFNFLADKTSLTVFHKKIKLFIQGSAGSPPIPEEFFSSMMSILMPNWTARFHNEEFRSVVENMILENKPANISTQIHWLSLKEMKTFEQMYKDWTEEKIKAPTAQSKKLGEYSLAFTELLLAYV